MKATKTKTVGRNRSRLASINTYLPYPDPDADILDTDEAKVMKYYNHDIDILDTDEDLIMQYYKSSLTQNESSRSWRKRIHA